MFRHILVPIDLSARNGAALDAALELARQNRARVTLLHVVQRIEHLPASEVRGFYRRLEKAARTKMQAAARRFTAKKVDVRTTIVVGTPAPDIVACAAANDVDLIVLASHRVDLDRRDGWGTTSYKVGVLCPCPVLLVK
jgi:nucleotide-binding universal stress UspA family protein